jgi:hypothetical protein
MRLKFVNAELAETMEAAINQTRGHAKTAKCHSDLSRSSRLRADKQMTSGSVRSALAFWLLN